MYISSFSKSKNIKSISFEFKKEEDILTLAMLPPVAKQFLKGELEEEPFPEVHIGDSGDNDLGAIPTEYSVEVDGDIFDVKIMPTGFMQIGENDSGNIASLYFIISFIKCLSMWFKILLLDESSTLLSSSNY